jgi:hypothetical protein
MRLLSAAVCLALTAAPVAAQLQSGARVRVWETQPDAPPVELIAHVRSADARTITLDAPAGPITVPWARVSHVEVSQGPSSGPRWKSGLIGGLAGVIGGGVLGVIIGNASNHNAPKFGAVGIGVGGAAGAVIGAMNPGERWAPATH